MVHAAVVSFAGAAMTVYVDDMCARFGRMIMCHMIADTDAELHAMAKLIGIDRRWHQTSPKASSSHYDIALVKRALAIGHGAVEITYRDCALMSINRMRGSATAPLVTPAQGLLLLRARGGAVPAQAPADG